MLANTKITSGWKKTTLALFLGVGIVCAEKLNDMQQRMAETNAMYQALATNNVPWASPTVNLAGNEFSEDDIYYSNQGAAGTCTRHAVAKGIQKEITSRTNNAHKFHTLALVQWLVNH